MRETSAVQRFWIEQVLRQLASQYGVDAQAGLTGHLVAGLLGVAAAMGCQDHIVDLPQGMLST